MKLMKYYNLKRYLIKFIFLIKFLDLFCWDTKLKNILIIKMLKLILDLMIIGENIYLIY